MDAATLTGEAAITRLLEGNARFVSGEMERRDHAVQRAKLVDTVSPFAVVLSCADARVPPELVFDQGIGDIFCVRLAGNAATEAGVVGSIEYAVSVQGAGLVLVLGHQGCGAVTAALEQVRDRTGAAGAIGTMLEPLLPAAQEAARLPAATAVGEAVRLNVRRQVRALRTSPAVLAPLVSAGRLTIAGAYYSMSDGLVSLVD